MCIYAHVTVHTWRLAVGVEFHWDDIRYFVALSEQKRLSRAAAQLRVEHTTVARRINQLEERLGVLLFRRASRGFSLTPDGERLLTEALRMAESARSFSELAKAGSSRSNRNVKVAIIESLAVEWLAPQLARFHEAHPEIELEVMSDGTLSDLASGEADLAIRAPKPTDRELIYTRLATVSFGVYGTPRAVIQTKEALRLSASFRLLTFPDTYDHLQGAKWFSQLRPKAITTRSNSTLALLEAAQKGAGVAVLPSCMAERKQLERLDPRDVSNVSIWLVSHPASRQNPYVRNVASFLRKIATGPNGLY